MDENKQEPVEEVKEEVVETPATEVKEDRPEANYKAELERKNRELERMRMELASRQQEKPAYNPNDIKTWPDHELKALLKDQQFARYHNEAEDILFDRKVEAKLAAKADSERRVSAEMQLREKFPEALDPSSELAVRMEKIMQENDLSKTPAGRLVAAKLAATELNQGKNASDARGRKAEQDRVASVKKQMVDGDRPKPTNTKSNDDKQKALKEKLLNERSTKHEAMGDFLDQSGMRERFKKVWGE